MTTFYAVFESDSPIVYLPPGPAEVEWALSVADSLLADKSGSLFAFYPNVGEWKPGGRAAHSARAGMGDDFAWEITRDQAEVVLRRLSALAVLPL